MRDAVICEPLRTPVGGFGGSLRDVPAARPRRHGDPRADGAHRPPPEAVDDVILGHCYPTMDAPAIGRVAALDAGLPVTASGHPDRPPLRLRPAGGALRGDAGADRRLRPGARRRRRVDEQRAVLLDRPCAGASRPGPGVLLHDGLARGRVTAGGSNHPVPGGMLETAENLRARVPHPARGAGRVRRPLAPARGRRRRGRPVRRRDRAGDGDAAARATPSSTATSTSGPTRTSRRSPRCARSWARTTRRPPSPPATPAGRTTAPRSASSPRRRRRPSWGCGRWPGWSPGASAGCRRRRWASARCRRRRRRWRRPT